MLGEGSAGVDGWEGVWWENWARMVREVVSGMFMRHRGSGELVRASVALELIDGLNHQNHPCFGAR